MHTVLVCDDDRAILDSIEIYLKAEGFNVLKAENGAAALEVISENSIECLVLDIMMPGLDGLQTTMKIREEKRDFPIIMLSAKSEDTDKIAGLGFGADDYVTKPFSPKEVMARINAVTKRRSAASENTNPDVYKFEGLTVDMAGRNVYVDGEKAELTPKEYEILFYFIKNKGIALTREKLLYDVWGFDFYGDDRTVDTHIKMLRANLKQYRKFIVTLRGLGYKFEA